ncbi:MAG: hypothetical protein ACE5FA_12600 [Dehalococcoidia bacterium]
MVDSDFFSSGETMWAPASPLPAGRYWWIVTTATTEGFELRRTEPLNFVINTRLRVKRSKALKDTGFVPSVEIRAVWVTNVRKVRVIVRVRNRKGRFLARGVSPSGSRWTTGSWASVPGRNRTHVARFRKWGSGVSCIDT